MWDRIVVCDALRIQCAAFGTGIEQKELGSQDKLYANTMGGNPFFKKMSWKQYNS